MDTQTNETMIKMTSYSHGSGCGCKIAPDVLSQILQSQTSLPSDNLLVGNQNSDDAAAYDLKDGKVLLATTDFFMPIVDNAFEFGMIAAVNAISDIYAMGGTPLMALAILGWPIDKLSPQVAARVLEGGRHACSLAGIPLAGGHSIDSPEPIFGLAVNGLVEKQNLKTNAAAKAGDILYLTKKLGIGILTTAEKKDLLRQEHRGLAASEMKKLNNIGKILAAHDWVHAITDVTGFGLLGHLWEMCHAADVNAEVDFSQVRLLTDLHFYLQQKSIPGGAFKNWRSYGKHIKAQDEDIRTILCDPQTSGGLLVAIDAAKQQELEEIFKAQGLQEFCRPIGKITTSRKQEQRIEVI